MGLDLLYVAQPASAAAQSAAMRIIAEEALAASCDVWLLHRPEDRELLDGVIIPSRKVGFIHEGALPLRMRPLPADIPWPRRAGETTDSLAPQRLPGRSISSRS